MGIWSKAIRSKIKNHEVIFSYFSLLVISVEIMNIVYSNGLFHLDIQSIQYFLSTLSQVEGTIIAIYITMVLVAVQLTPREYSEVMFRVYLNKAEFWLVFASYVSSIVLALVSLQNARELSIKWILFIGTWGIFNIALLPIFVKDSFMMFNPERVVINELMDKITYKEYLNYDTIELNGNNETTISILFKVAINAIQVQNADIVILILEEISKYFRSSFLSDLERSLNTETDTTELKAMIIFIEKVSTKLGLLARRVIIQAYTDKMSKDDMRKILEMIQLVFRQVFHIFVYYLTPNTVPNFMYSGLERSINQCFIEVESILEELEKDKFGLRIGLRILDGFITAVPSEFTLTRVGWGQNSKDILQKSREIRTRLRESREEKETTGSYC